MQLAVVDDVGATIGIAGAHQARGKADALAELQRPRFLGDERIGAGFDDEAVDALGGDRPAETRRGLQQCQREWLGCARD